MDKSQVIECFAGDVTDYLELGVQLSAPGVIPVEIATLDASFICKIGVVGATPPISRVVTVKDDGNQYFRGWLTPTETAALGPGTWLLGMQISNPSLPGPFVKERRWTLRIRAQSVD